MRAHFLLLLGPSGVGKSTLIRVLKELDNRFVYISPFTTRTLREGETDKIYMSQSELNKFQAEGKLLTINELYGVSYATPLAPIENAFANNLFPVLDYPIQKLEIMQATFNDRLFCAYIEPPSIEVLEKRLSNDARDKDNKRLNLGKTELDSLWRGEFDSKIHCRVVCYENKISDVANSIYQKYLMVCYKDES